jgi:hypothetical protein
MPAGAESIAVVIAEEEKRAEAAQDTTSDFFTKVSIWFEMEASTASLRDLMRLREPAIDEDCRIAGCGTMADRSSENAGRILAKGPKKRML